MYQVKLLSVLCIGIALATLPIAAQPSGNSYAPTAIPKTFQGTIVSIEDDLLTLTTRDGEESFLVVDGAMVLLNGVESTLSALSAGQFATVTAEQNGEHWLANFVDAKLKK